MPLQTPTQVSRSRDIIPTFPLRTQSEPARDADTPTILPGSMRPSDDHPLQISPSRTTPLCRGFSLLLLVALALQLPTFHLSAVNHSGRHWSPIRLVAQSIVIQESRVVQRQRELPGAAVAAAVHSRQLAANIPIRAGVDAPSSRRLIWSMLDLPPPAAA
jgi:hypothetical protein